MKFSSKDAQQGKEGMKAKATGNKVGLGLKQHRRRDISKKNRHIYEPCFCKILYWISASFTCRLFFYAV